MLTNLNHLHPIMLQQILKKRREKARNFHQRENANQSLICDVSIVLSVEQQKSRRGTLTPLCTLVALHMEVNGQKTLVYLYEKVAQQCCSALVCQPQTYGCIIENQSLTFYQFVREPENSEIMVSQESISFSGCYERETIGSCFIKITQWIILMIFDRFLSLQEVRKGYVDLHNQGLRPNSDPPKTDLCTHPSCWYIEELQHLDRMITEKGLWEKNTPFCMTELVELMEPALI